jgi:branched-chain amino acid transport system permease protein
VSPKITARIPPSHAALGLALVFALGLSFFADRFNSYYLDVLTGIGINIILAVSLNLVNGFTGQFSLGHAGFMSVGAYLSAAVTVFLGPQLLGRAPSGVLLQPAGSPPPWPAWSSGFLRCD